MIQLYVLTRKDFGGRKCVAPFINGQNIWDIPVRQWTAEVRAAVLSAYKIGVEHGARHSSRPSIVSELTDGPIDWLTPSGENE